MAYKVCFGDAVGYATPEVRTVTAEAGKALKYKVDYKMDW